MWKLINIHAENLCAFKELDFIVPQNVTTLVFGNNMDNDSQGSNGSGKSALIEAIAIGLTGEPLRKVKADEIIRDDAENCVITLTLKNSDGTQAVVSRQFFRKSPQEIKVTLNDEVIPQATVNDYNKYVLELIGLTKEDLYSNFILSKNKYVSFLSSSDKDKKELINRFSNGLLVDESLEFLESDIAICRKKQADADKNVAYLKGTVETLQAQIENLRSEAGDAKKQERLADLDKRIAETREATRKANSTIQHLENKWDQIEELEKELKQVESLDLSFGESFNKLKKLWQADLLGPLNDYEEDIERTHAEIKALTKTQAESISKVNDYEAEVLRATEVVKQTERDFQNLTDQTDLKLKNLQKQIDTWKQTITSCNQQMQELLTRKQRGSKYTADLMAALAGSIECPNCHHKWVVNSGLTIEEMHKQLEAAKQRQLELDSLIEDCTTGSKEAKENISKAHQTENSLEERLEHQSKQVAEAKKNMNKLKTTLQDIQEDARHIEQRLGVLNQRIVQAKNDMFASIYNAVDLAIKNIDSQIKVQEYEIATNDGSLVTLEATKKQIEEYSVEATIKPLKESLNESEGELKKAQKSKDAIDAELTKLTVQEARFVEFKTYLANTKVEALSAMTNEFLQAIGSDIRIAFSGFTLLKSGKIRDKISISLLRDGVDCGSFGKFSQGERSRCELATILALQKLINTNCEDGKGLDLLVIDEIMDGIDEDGLSSIFETLNNLQVTSLVVSHGLVHEGYQHRLIINKHNGVSFI